MIGLESLAASYNLARYIHVVRDLQAYTRDGVLWPATFVLTPVIMRTDTNTTHGFD
jgi:hypothetical protein